MPGKAVGGVWHDWGVVGSIEDDFTDPATQATDRSATDPAELERGQQIERFVLLDELGRGGMGVVWSAYDPELDRRVAIKLLYAGASGDSGSADSEGRFRHEAQIMAKLRHPNVVTLYEVGRHGDELFLAMEYVADGTLGAFATARRADGANEIVHAYVAAARGLAAAHEVGIVHGDFKPANVLMDDGRPLVADFGLARGPKSSPDPEGGAVAGTPRYMAPELLQGAPASTASDQFAFCVSLYESLFGDHPFEGDNALTQSVAILDNRRKPKPAAPAIAPWLWNAIERGLSPDPERRWPSMSELAEVLESPERSGAGRNPRTVAGLSLGVALLMVPVVTLAAMGPRAFETFPGSLIIPGSALGAIGLLYAVWREALLVTAFNRKAFAALAVFFVSDFLYWTILGAMDGPVAYGSSVAFVLWSSLIAMFGALVDRRALWLAGVYLGGGLGSLVWDGSAMGFSLLGNLGFLVLVWSYWRRPPG